ncbi:MAG: TonB-dependent receptor [Bacteroidota bacterium]|nr:TonB-dependent receptor [Bacteroidota bacterium]
MLTHSRKLILPLLLICFSFVTTFAQEGPVGQLQGRVIDGNSNDFMEGAIVKIEGLKKGARVDYEGKYKILDIPAGTYTILVNYVGYQPLRKEMVVIKDKAVVEIDFSVFAAGQVIEVRGVKKQGNTTVALIETVKTLPVVGNAISSQQIKALPDRSSGDALKRVTGATIQDNKFAIIRGLNDRYNGAMINGSPLPSTEAERRAFSFDMIPSNMLDNIIILKTASPDLPGDFSGGLIQLNTKDVPDKLFVNVGVSGSYNNLTTGQTFYGYEGGKTDYLGRDDGTRSIPSIVPADYKDFFVKLNKNQQADAGRVIGSKGWLIEKSNALPNGNFQFSVGAPIYLRKSDSGTSTNQLGIVFSIDYNNIRKNSFVKRYWYSDVASSSARELDLTDTTSTSTYSLGGLANITYKLNRNTKFYFKNTLSQNAENQTTLRQGQNIINGSQDLNFAYQWTQNRLTFSQLGGEHFLEKSKMVVNYNLSYGSLTREVPFFRNLGFARAIGDFTTPFGSSIGQNVNEESAIFYTDLTENIYSGGANMTIPGSAFIPTTDVNTGKTTGGFGGNAGKAFGKFLNESGSIKFGVYKQDRDRAFNARLLGFKLGNQPMPNPTNILNFGLDSIFRGTNFSKDGFILDDITNNTSNYSAASKLNSGYFMFDVKQERIRAVFGVRFESYNQKINTFGKGNDPFIIDTTNNDFLPSLNLTYRINKKQNFRASAFRSLARPEFRELAGFAFYDFNTFSLISGNPNLLRTSIWNFDVRYEIYPRSGETISGAVFHKDFTNPIEQVLGNEISVGNLRREYFNPQSASLTGAEIEFRKNIFGRDSLNTLTVFGNTAYMLSNVTVAQIDSNKVFKQDRPLQGQSPFIVNVGLQFVSADTRLTATLSYNRIGNRIFSVGTKVFGDIFEKGRNIVDAQVSYGFLKENKLSVKVGLNDLLANDLVYFQNKTNEKSTYGKFDNANSNEMFRYKMPRIVSFGVAYRIF